MTDRARLGQLPGHDVGPGAEQRVPGRVEDERAPQAAAGPGDRDPVPAGPLAQHRQQRARLGGQVRDVAGSGRRRCPPAVSTPPAQPGSRTSGWPAARTKPSRGPVQVPGPIRRVRPSCCGSGR
ncbi:hypothetical protein AB0H83_42615 [Dactylosporangium sp. NPDC050688]|uniref:hypothetical protein n=1 Tax=Dactylosporangium sp. NPDC050688 TaxID=3157217 RepID=UPI0033C31E8D